ncbi:hypothetical protein CC86DRAFT_174792 [Ophiobolus disseminans]|uniref:Uncharacterized protein n=1 Tax=Ophiobolus disseminans TaxID=1469910 RepID=A0A6A7AAS3_9PLEO|nr:hypothetical protein CC86DRAFT_174792 [Ophiobolus disseminans]
MAGSDDIEKAPYESVQQVDQDVSSLPPTTEKRRTKWEKLGAYNIWVLAIGTIVILLSVAFLVFVWVVSLKQGTSEHQPRLWIDIVRKDYTSRVVTIATLLVRVALAAQLCVFAAIMAALILERVGASNEDFPMLSMIRCANTGPQALIWNVFHTITKGTQLGYSFIIVITILNALALQFMSTMLLADFGNPSVVLDPQERAVNWGIDASRESAPTVGSDFWRSSQPSYPAFAEYKQNGTQGTNYIDSGATYRGFLPFNNATLRENILSYSGPMTVVDERVVCVKPTLTNAEFRIPAHSDDTLSANINFNNTHSDIVQHGYQTGFNCTMPHYWHVQHSGYWYASLCRLDLGSGELRGGILPEDDTRTHETNVWLIFNVTSAWNVEEQWLQMVADKEETVVLPLRQLESPDGAWAKIGHANMTVDVSLCLLNPKPDVYDVEVLGSRSTITTDNSIYWDPATRKYETGWSRLQLDALGAADLEEAGFEATRAFSQEERGVLSLQAPATSWNSTRAPTAYKTTKYQPMIHGSLDKNKPWNYAGGMNDSFILTPKADFADAIHRNHMWVTQDILNRTNNPAKALQAVTHIVMQTAYYDWFANYDLNVTATYSMTEQRYIPLTWKHFAAVAGLLVLHFVLVVFALVLFFMKTEVSLLGNAWQAVAQVVSNDTAAAVQHGTMATDEEVRKSVKSSGFHESPVVIRRSERNGRLEAVSVKPVSRGSL